MPTASSVLPDGRLVELTYIKSESRTAFAVNGRGTIEITNDIRLADKTLLLPISPTNNLIRHEVLLFAEKPEPYESTEALRKELERFINRYVDLTPAFRAIAVAYAMLTWVYDAFNELPYLRLQGEYGSGKTRALTVLGSLCNKGFFASGASSVSTIFYTLDRFQGTLILDEADFRFSDEKTEIVKILNNGNVRGFPVLRQTVTPQKEFEPRAFTVFGPKIVAMRHSFDDPALESRCITEVMGQRKVRADIPLNLPDAFKNEALHLRNKLLSWRFAMHGTFSIDRTFADEAQTSRTNQVLLPLLAVIHDEDTRQLVRSFVADNERELKADRAQLPEGMLLDVLVDLFVESGRTTIPISEITKMFVERFGKDVDHIITPRYVGSLLRKRLHLSTYKSHGVFVLPSSLQEKVLFLAKRFGIDRAA